MSRKTTKNTEYKISKVHFTDGQISKIIYLEGDMEKTATRDTAEFEYISGICRDQVDYYVQLNKSFHLSKEAESTGTKILNTKVTNGKLIEFTYSENGETKQVKKSDASFEFLSNKFAVQLENHLNLTAQIFPQGKNSPNSAMEEKNSVTKNMIPAVILFLVITLIIVTAVFIFPVIF